MREYCDRKRKLNSSLIIIIFILNVIFISWNAEFKADTVDENHQEISGINPKPLSSGGINWSQIEVISEPIRGMNINTGNSGWKSIAVEDEKIYVVWDDKSNANIYGPDYDLFYRFYNGTNWSDIQVISEPVPGQNLNTENSRFPSIAVEDSKIYVVWQDWNETNNAGIDWDISYRCNLTGTGWEDIQVISEPIPGQDNNKVNSTWPKIAVDNGKIYTVWEDMNNTTGAGFDDDIFYRCNISGTNWEPVQVISEPVPGQDINTGGSYRPDIAAENGKIYTAWSDGTNINGAGTDLDIFYKCNLTGTNWEPVQVVSEPVRGQNFNTGRSGFGDIAVENGKIYLVWNDANDTNGAGIFDKDIFFKCNLTGTNWEPVQVISEPVFGKNYNLWDCGWEQIAVNDNNIHIVWDDRNDTNGAGTVGHDISYRCNITGVSWEDIEVVSEPVPGFNFNTRPNVGGTIAVDQDKCHVIWTSQNNTNGAGNDQDIFYRCNSLVPPPLYLWSPRASPKLGNTSTDFNFSVTYNQLNNTPPTRMKIILDGIEHTMLEVDQTDTNYTNGKQYYFSIKNLAIGNHTYKFNASDGIRFTKTRLFKNLKVENSLPRIITENSLTVNEDQYYEVIYAYEDIDIANIGQSCHWEFATNANWLSFDLASGKLFGTPGNDDVGKYWVNIAVNDSLEIISTNFTLKVLDVNDKPIIITDDVVSTNEDELYEVDYNATDIDSITANQRWSLETTAMSWLNLSSSYGILNGTPENDDVGVYWVNITVNDTEGGSDFTNFTLTVLNVNDDPVIITKISSKEILTGSDELYSVQYNATDIDSPQSKFRWSLDSNATWLSIGSSTGVLSGTPSRADAGSYFVNVSVSDGAGGSDWDEFLITVYLSNLPPKISNVDLLIANVNETYNIDYNATDDRETYLLEWSLNTNASWLSINKYTGNLSGTPTEDHGGKQYWVNITIRDTQNGFDFHNFTITVQKELIILENSVPKLLNFKLIPEEGDTNTQFTFIVTYLDLDFEPPEIIQIVLDGDGHDMDLRSEESAFNGIYEFTTKLTAGTHSYYFTTSDGTDTNTSGTFSTPEITTPKKINDIDQGTGEEGLAWESLVLIIVIVVIIVLILIFLMIGKKKRKDEIAPSGQVDVQEPVIEPTPQPAQQDMYVQESAPVPPIYPDYQPEESMVQEDLYAAPVESIPEQLPSEE